MKRVGRTAVWLMFFMMPVAGLGQLPSKALLKQRADELGTSGPSSRQAHEILAGGVTSTIQYPTIVVGIEKAAREKIRTQLGPNQHHSQEERDILSRLTLPGYCSAGSPSASEKRQCQLVRQQKDSLLRYLDDGKRTFVSHIAYWNDPRATTPNLSYSAYVDCRGGGAVINGFDCGKTAYENSWAALNHLQTFIQNLLAAGGFTHVVLISKGWNTTQSGSVDDFDQLMGYIGSEAQAEQRPFRPLVVGITWHSAWVWPLSRVPVLKLLPTVASYGNKAKDADEIGITWANFLLNRVLLPEAGAANLPVIAIGHSFGARIVTRAAASAHLIGAAPANQVSLLLSLQGAFSMNRLLSERCRGREGAPYADLTSKVSRVALGWSRKDLTNPLAQIVSHANHVGGRPGHRRARAYEHRYLFKEWRNPGFGTPTWTKRQGHGKKCDAPPDVPKIEMIDASPIVKRHGDVNDDQMARLVWALMQAK